VGNSRLDTKVRTFPNSSVDCVNWFA